MEAVFTAFSRAAYSGGCPPHFEIAANFGIAPIVKRKGSKHRQLQGRCSTNATLIVRALLADDQISGVSIAGSAVTSCRELNSQRACLTSWVPQGADNQSMTYADHEMGNAGSSSLIGMGGPSVAGFSPDTTSSLIAFELLTTAVGSTGSTLCSSAIPSAEVHVLAAAVSATMVSQEDPLDTSIAAVFDQERQQVDRAINALMIGAAAIYAATKVLTVDHDYWHGWTVFEILRYAPMHNWSAYEQALKSNPVLAKMMISGIVYSLGDWIAQCYEGKPVLDFKRERMIRSALVGFCLHGSLSHYYYHVCEALFPFKAWWVVPLKVAFDQTIWSGFWNSVYFVVLGLLRLESPFTIASELKGTFWPLLTAGWKLWPFAHLITYGFVPLEQRLLWVDMVELVWVTILSMYSNEKAEARMVAEASVDTTSAAAGEAD